MVTAQLSLLLALTGVIVWAGDGAVRLTAVMVDETAEPGSVLVETGRLAEGQVLD